MCNSAEIWSDFRKYERFGGELSIGEFMQLVTWTKRKATWIQVVPKGLRQAITDGSARKLWPDIIVSALMAESEAQAQLVEEMELQRACLEKAEKELVSAKPTKAAANERRVALSKIAAAEKELEDLESPARSDGNDRIWPGHFAPVMIHNLETGHNAVLPMRYQCRLPGRTEKDELEAPEMYNAHRDKLTSLWHQVFGVQHGVIGVHRFYESVLLRDNQRRALAPRKYEQSIEIAFQPEDGVDLLVACLWTYVERLGEDPGFYTFAVVVDSPPPEVANAGPDRCIVSLREQDIEAWLSPIGRTPAELQVILDQGTSVRPHLEHELVLESC
jgi:putative SOS response-associated peptidase YedK